MKALILAAGFGTRMGEMSKTPAKPLLPVNGKPVLEHLAEKIFATGEIDSLTVITNNYYFSQFYEWKEKRPDFEVLLINDGVNTNETRLGAIADLDLVIEKIGKSEPLFVMAGDNLFEFDFSEMIDCFHEKESDIVAAYRQKDREKLKKTGVISLDENARIVDFQEKPDKPKSDYAVPCIYIFEPDTLSLIGEYLKSGCNPDAPGNFIAWLYGRKPVYAFVFESKLYSIGDAGSYEATRKALEK